jgi:hypothetical protein
VTPWFLLAAGLFVLYLLALVAFRWLQHGRDAMNAALCSEHRPESDSVLASLSRVNPGYRFRRWSDDEQLVTRPPVLPRSIIGDQSR